VLGIGPYIFPHLYKIRLRISTKDIHIYGIDMTHREEENRLAIAERKEKKTINKNKTKER
jgi:hypothetical protein